MTLKKTLFYLTTLFFFIQQGHAQMVVTNAPPYDNEVYLVEDVLVGQGVTISNVSVTGQSVQIGYFDGANSNIGLDAGVVMSSGDIFDIPAGGNQPSTGQFAGPGDPDLLTVAQSVASNPNAGGINATEDAAILEFDFTPSGDTVQFNFVFASEEYTTYINTVFNDAFGFFVSGPGFTGPYSSPAGFPNGAENLAVVPGTATPITISTIYNDPNQIPPTMNDTYYLDGPVGHDFNGFTIPITIVFPVQCGETYHFKFAVTDCQDDFLDTGVFLEAESFSSNDIDISLSTGVTSLDSDSTIVEGCTEAVFNFIRADTTDTLVIHYTSSGSAIEGLDFDSIADSLVFYPGIDSIALVITPIDDGIPELQDTIKLSVLKITPCGDTVYVEGVVYIMEDYEVEVIVDSLTVNCPGDSLALIAVGDNGIPDFEYVWENGQTGDTLWVGPTLSNFFTVSVTDSCAISMGVDSFYVNVPEFDEFMIFSEDTFLACPGDLATLSAEASGGASGYSYTWDPIPNNTANINVSPFITTDYSITITDQCGATVDTTIVLNVPGIDSIDVNIETTGAVVCSGDALLITGQVSGGIGYGHTYTWLHDLLDNDSIITPLINKDTSFAVIITDGCGYSQGDTINISLPAYSEVSASTPLYYLLCKDDTLSVEALASGGAGDYTYNWTGNGQISDASNSQTLLTPVDESGYTLMVTDQCGDADTLSILIEFDDCSVVGPKVFTPNGDGYNQHLRFTNLEKHPNSRIVIYNRWGSKVYESDNYLNNWNGDNQKDGVYFYTLYVSNGDELQSYIHLLR